MFNIGCIVFIYYNKLPVKHFNLANINFTNCSLNVMLVQCYTIRLLLLFELLKFDLSIYL